MNNDTKKVLEDLFTDLCNALADKLKSGEATAADLNVVRQLLKDNNINAPALPGTPLHNIVSELPFPQTEDEYEHSFN